MNAKKRIYMLKKWLGTKFSVVLTGIKCKKIFTDNVQLTLHDPRKT